jgi:hypothetical protein
MLSHLRYLTAEQDDSDDSEDSSSLRRAEAERTMAIYFDLSYLSYFDITAEHGILVLTTTRRRA